MRATGPGGTLFYVREIRGPLRSVVRGVLYRSPMTSMPMLSGLTLSSLCVATIAYAGFFAAMLVAARVVPGPRVLGFSQPDGQRKHYRMHGLALFVLTHMVVIAGTLVFGLSLAPLVTTWFWPLFAAANVFAVVWALALYVGGRARGHAGTGNFLQDVWMGVELNPTWRGVDLKVFAYQPSLIGLGVLVAAFGYAQYEAIGTLTPQMVLYQAFWWLYLFTHYRDEAGVLSMYDVIAEKFGFMLVWGDLVLVPFFYCIAGWTLAQQTEPMAWPGLVALCVAYGVGLWVFRGANKQKHVFKSDPNAEIWGAAPRLLGGRLLVSGWWGVGRKINYAGELTVYFATAATAGLASIQPFLVPLWLLGLLVHRAWRDEQRCSAKYGDLWREYCRVVPGRILPSWRGLQMAIRGEDVRALKE